MQWIRKIHKWTSLVVGLQFLLWLASGLYFNLMDHHKAGGHTYRNHDHQEIEPELARLVEPKDVLANNPQSVSVQTITLLDTPYYLLTHRKGLYANFKNSYSLVNAYSGEKVTIDRNFASALARASYSGPGEIASARLLESPREDFPKQQNPTWQINFADDIETSVYIEAGSGRLVGHSDAHKRLADIFFMLHFMDYGNAGGFNNLPIMLFAFVTLWLCLTGLVWTVDLAIRGQYKLPILASRNKVILYDHDRNALGEVELSSADNILDGLVEKGIALPSTCGGGGTCGRCKVLLTPPTPPTSADISHFSKSELDQGFRLACQHFSTEVSHMTLYDVTGAQKVSLTLVNGRFVSPDIKELRFKASPSQPDYQAGAFMRFFIPPGTGYAKPRKIPAQYRDDWAQVSDSEYQRQACSRSYSMASPSQLDDELVFTIKYQSAPNDEVPSGAGSSYLCNMNVGQSVDALGPFEDFFAERDYTGTMILIGAGSGMAPLRAIILERLLVMQSTQPIHFYFGARTQQDLLYREELCELSRRFSNFEFTPVLSKPDKAWQGATGYVQQAMLNTASGETLLAAHFYLCGPGAMMEQTMAELKRLGVRENAINFDSFA